MLHDTCMTMSEELQRVDVILTRIISPTEFWITIPTDDRNNEPCPYNTTDFSKQKTYRKYLKWIKGTDTNLWMTSNGVELYSYFNYMIVFDPSFRSRRKEMSFGIPYSNRFHVLDIDSH